VTTRTFRAVIFDLDGVLWDGEPLYHEAFNLVLEPHGYRVSDDDYSEIIGLSVEAAWHWVHHRFDLTASPDGFLRAYNEAVLHLLQRPVEPLPGVRPLIDTLRRRGVPMGLASASLRPWVDATLRGLGLQDAFDAVVSGSEVSNGKPAPDPFLAAAARLGVPPDRCLVVEDTGPGIAAAKAAGMFAVQLCAASTALPPLPDADLVLESLSDFDLSLLDTSAHPEPAEGACPEPAEGVEP
jgi:HAD superfamily hydrolase (TIGR01509 family)